MAVSVGRVVQYRLTERDAAYINKRRMDAQKRLHPVKIEDGAQIHFGNDVAAGEVLPLIVTKVWPNDIINGQVLLDGNDTYWARSIYPTDEAEKAGFWTWPPRVK